MKKLLIILGVVGLVFGMGPVANATRYENAEDGDTDGWFIGDSDPPGATVSNIYDASWGSRVIELSETANDSNQPSDYFLKLDENGDPWDNSTEFIFAWSMNASSESLIYVEFDVNENDDEHYIYYGYQDNNYGMSSKGLFLGYGLGSGYAGSWETFTRDLTADFAFPGLTIKDVNGLWFNGDGKYDNIELKTSIPDPAAVFLLGAASLIGFAGLRRKSRKS